MNTIVLPANHPRLAMPEIIDLLARQSALRFFERDCAVAVSDLRPNDKGVQEPKTEDELKAVVERVVKFRQMLERRAWMKFIRYAVIRTKTLIVRDAAGEPSQSRGSLLDLFVTTTELASWLIRRGHTVEFDPAPECEGGACARRLTQAGSAPRRKLKRSALIDLYERQWPTIRMDISNAPRNGLSVAQIDGERGFYYEEIAIDWAIAQGRFRRAEDYPPAALPEVQETSVACG